MKRFAIPLLSLALTACTGVPIPGQGTAQPTPGFSASLSASTVTASRGNSATVIVTTGTPATFAVSQPPAGVTVQPAGDRFSLTNVSAADGTHPLTVTVTPTDGRPAVTLPLTLVTSGAPTTPGVTPLTVSANPDTVTLAQGQQQFVTLSSNLPAGFSATASVVGLDLAVSGNVLTLRNVSAPAGQHGVYVTGIGPQGQGATAVVIVNVPGATAPTPTPTPTPTPNPPPVNPPAEFTASVTPTSATVNRGASTILTVSANQSFTYTVGQAPGFTVSTSGNTITVTNASAPNGTVNLPITVTGGGQVRSLNVALTAAGAPSYRAPGESVIGESGVESQTLALINELRTQGTLNGDASVRNGTCAANWSPLPALAYHGGLHFAARKHADYLAYEMVRIGEIPASPHVQENASNPHFYGQLVGDRTTRAFTEHNFAPMNGVGYENIAYDDNPYNAVLAWLRSPGHCTGLITLEVTHAAIGQAGTGARTGQYGVLNAWVLKTRGSH